MAKRVVETHNEVQPRTEGRLRAASPGVCGCGAVYDYGSVAVPPELTGLCGRCAFARGRRLGR